ncbi:PA14 domain-containing protein [Paraflavitalea speifideaquila]|uniref:PA14 domain-containing protein n=1 Tax=Paraflavitalea speifideaquila TaxID=3076558 RepID=UPI0028E31380|nr:PA14 domain-containing protein [Paraflavitalea speifideiaquila]
MPLEVVNNDTLNPYRYGILGNWRIDTSFTYYAGRKQSDFAAATNIRTDGAIKGFVPFWALQSGFMKLVPDSTRWVWNSKTTLVNGKGVEMENVDPLNRYNAGLYGYNKTLPVAVAQNSRHREITFDGFEDRDYKTSPCATCDDNGWIKLADYTVAGRTDYMSHTGRYSYKVYGSNSTVTKVPIATSQADTASTRISLKVDSLPLVTQTVTPKGNGLLTQYGIYRARPALNINPCVGHNITGSTIEWSPTTAITLPKDSWKRGQGPSQICAKEYFAVKWTGKLQPQYSGNYTFKVTVDDEITLKIGGVTIISYTGVGPVTRFSPFMRLNAGQLYDIEVLMKNGDGDGGIDLTWGNGYVGLQVPIPASCLYQTAAQANGSVVNDTTWCVKFRSPVPVNAIHNKFSPLQGSKMVFSAWVKEEIPCPAGSSYNSGRVRLTFNNGSGVTYTLKPKGNIIEGWQRIEEVVDIPANVTEMNVFLETATSTAAYFDDLRMHPFNSNMKSFAYDPINLRLMAELDENNHATFYEYDDEGTLIRVKKKQSGE